MMILEREESNQISKGFILLIAAHPCLRRMGDRGPSCFTSNGYFRILRSAFLANRAASITRSL